VGAVNTVRLAFEVAPDALTRLLLVVTVEALLCLALLAWNLRGRS
jgi:hypothetical protein